MDPHRFDANMYLYPTFHFDADPDPDPPYILMPIWILSLLQVLHMLRKSEVC